MLGRRHGYVAAAPGLGSSRNPAHIATTRRGSKVYAVPVALNLLRHDTSVKLEIANKRRKAGGDENYLLGILLQE